MMVHIKSFTLHRQCFQHCAPDESMRFCFIYVYVHRNCGGSLPNSIHLKVFTLYISMRERTYIGSTYNSKRMCLQQFRISRCVANWCNVKYTSESKICVPWISKPLSRILASSFCIYFFPLFSFTFLHSGGFVYMCIFLLHRAQMKSFCFVKA